MEPWGFAAKLYLRGALPIGSGMTAMYVADEFLQMSFLFALLFGGGTGLLAFVLSRVAEDGDKVDEATGAMLRGTLAVALAPMAFAITYLIVSRAGTFPALPLSMIAAIAGAVAAYWVLHQFKPQRPTTQTVLGREAGGVRQAILKAHLEAERKRREP